MTATVSCAHRRCLRVTKDPSGRCHDHRGASGLPPAPATPPPAPAALAPSFVFPDRGDDPPTRTEEINGSFHEFWEDEEGLLHRLGGPASIAHSSSGVPLFEAWSEHGKVHRRGGPAVTTFYPSGQLATEFFQVHEGWHRVDGPASIAYAEDGSVTSRTFYVDGRLASSIHEVGDRIESYLAPRLHDELTHSSYAPLLAEGHRPYAIVAAMKEGIGSVDGLRAYLTGTPLEWALAYEEGSES